MRRRLAFARWLDQSGTSAVEFALIAPAMLTMVIGCMEVGRLIWVAGALNYAVGEAARCASVTPSVCGTATQITTYASKKIPANIAPASAFTSTSPSCGHQVSASLSYPFTVMHMYSQTITLTAKACLL